MDKNYNILEKTIKNLIIEWLNKYNIKNYNINNDLTINVNGNVDLYGYSESQLPDHIQFNEVNGYFNIGYSQIKTLKGCPKIVNGEFYCSACSKLKTLKGAPEIIGSTFICLNCPKLISLEGAPEIVNGDFDCSYCDSLKSLKGSPKQVKKTFYCEFCRSLESLKGAPKNCEIYSETFR